MIHAECFRVSGARNMSFTPISNDYANVWLQRLAFGTEVPLSLAFQLVLPLANHSRVFDAFQ